MAELLLDDGFENVEVEAVVVGEVGTSGTTGGGFTNSLKAPARGEWRSALGLLVFGRSDGRRGRFLSNERWRADPEGPVINNISTRDPHNTDLGLGNLPRAPIERLPISRSSLYSCSSNSAAIRS